MEKTLREVCLRKKAMHIIIHLFVSSLKIIILEGIVPVLDTKNLGLYISTIW